MTLNLSSLGEGTVSGLPSVQAQPEGVQPCVAQGLASCKDFLLCSAFLLFLSVFLPCCPSLRFLCP